jgi:NSS family neurotransmitter:Na+ symporter
MKERDSFQSRLGFLLVSAGCAIGIGNVWKFPYITGQNGGGIFVLFYLLFLIIMGIPVLSMELAVGRASRQTAVRAYEKLEKPGSKWHLHGYACVFGSYMLMFYYTTVSGWMLGYFIKFLTGSFSAIDVNSEGAGDAVASVFTDMLGNPKEMMLWMGLTVVLGFLVVSSSVQKGLERVTKIMMIGLLCLIVILAVHSFFLKGALKGIAFYLLPSVKRASEVGLGNVITAAMNQAFFTLSLGIGCMEIFGSYVSREFSLTGEAARICVLDTFVALMSGLIIFPACFSYGIDPGQGPALIFITLPNVFINMAGGRLWGTLFFLFMTFASFSTVTAVFENLIACSMDNYGWDRKKAVIINLIVVFVMSIPCVLGYNVLAGKTFIGARDVLDSEDFIVSNLLLPLGSLIYLLFCVTRYGWGFDNYLEEVNTGSGLKMSPVFKRYFQFVLPILILIILVQGLI